MRVFIGILIAAVSLGCGSPNGTTTKQTGRIIEITDTTLAAGGSDTVRFGRLHSGETGVKRFRLRNSSSQTLVVARYEVSCQCVTPEFERRPLRPGEETPLSIRFDSRGERGWQMKLLKLYTTQSAEPLRIFVEADVEL